MFSVRAKLGGLYPRRVRMLGMARVHTVEICKKFILRCFAGIIGFTGILPKD